MVELSKISCGWLPGASDRGLVDVNLGIAEAIARPDVEPGDPPGEGRAGIDRIEVRDIAGVADEQAAVGAPIVGARAGGERPGFEIQAAGSFDPAAGKAADDVLIALISPAKLMFVAQGRGKLGTVGHDRGVDARGDRGIGQDITPFLRSAVST